MTVELADAETSSPPSGFWNRPRAQPTEHPDGRGGSPGGGAATTAEVKEQPAGGRGWGDRARPDSVWAPQDCSGLRDQKGADGTEGQG